MHFTPTYLDVGFDDMVLAEQAGDGRLDDDYHRELKAGGLLDATDLIDQRREFRLRAPDQYWDTFGAMPSDLPEEWYSTGWIADKALDQLRQWDAGGNLLMVGFIKPHHPFDAPDPWSSMYADRHITPLPGWTDRIPAQDFTNANGYFPYDGLTPPALERVMRQYYASINQIDHQVGRMLQVLREKGLYENTLIIYTSDHGDYLGFHHLLLKTGYPYDPLIRVPLIIRFPGSRQAGAVSDRLVSLVDLAPTILEQAGIEPPPEMSGLDLADPVEDRELVFAQGWSACCVARSRHHALILCADEARSQFFDLDRDPLQLENLIRERSQHELVTEYRERIMRWHLFDAPAPGKADARAPSIRPPTSPASVIEHRRGMLEYFDRHLHGGGEWELREGHLMRA